MFDSYIISPLVGGKIYIGEIRTQEVFELVKIHGTKCNILKYSYMVKYYHLVVVGGTVFFLNLGLQIYSNFMQKKKINNIETDLKKLSEQNNQILFQNKKLLDLLKDKKLSEEKESIEN